MWSWRVNMLVVHSVWISLSYNYIAIIYVYMLYSTITIYYIHIFCICCRLAIEVSVWPMSLHLVNVCIIFKRYRSTLSCVSWAHAMESGHPFQNVVYVYIYIYILGCMHVTYIIHTWCTLCIHMSECMVLCNCEAALSKTSWICTCRTAVL